MALVTNMTKFEQIKKEMAERQNKNNGGFANDDRQIVWEAGKTYKFRLLFYKNENTEFEGPFVEKWTHGARNAEGKYKMITCPTTQFAKSGFDKCPVCKLNNKLYNSKVKSDYELYKQFRRKFNGYAVALVIQDQQNPENEGHAKIMRFGIDIHRALKERIFGIQAGDDALDEELYVGFDAFNLDSGYDLIVRVSKQGEWLKYNVDFSRSKKAAEYDAEQLEEELKALKFGEDVREESEERLEEFYNECIMEQVGGASTDEMTDVMEESDAKTDEQTDDISDDISDMLNDINTTSAASTSTSKPKAKSTPKSEPKASDVMDVDALLSDIAAEVNGK